MRNQVAMPFLLLPQTLAQKLYSLSNTHKPHALGLESTCSRLFQNGSHSKDISHVDTMPCRTFMSGLSCSTNLFRAPKHALRSNQIFENNESQRTTTVASTESTDSTTHTKATTQGRQMRRLVRLHPKTLGHRSKNELYSQVRH